MSERTCHNCVFACCDLGLWLRCVYAGEPLVPQCANHPQWPGQMHEVPGIPCRHYRPKPALPQGDNVRLIPLGDGAYAYVDATDYEWLNQWTWYLCGGGYAGRSENGKIILMHRQIMQPPAGMLVDHRDANKANNCRSNLRICTRSENQANQRKQAGSYSRFKGVYCNKQNGKWCAQCYAAGKRNWLGYFDSEVEAARAYDYAAVAAFGPYARPNFPDEWPPDRRAELYTHRQDPPAKTGKKMRRSEGKKIRAKKTPPHAEAQRRRTTVRSSTGKKGGRRRTAATCVRRKTARRTKGRSPAK